MGLSRHKNITAAVGAYCGAPVGQAGYTDAPANRNKFGFMAPKRGTACAPLEIASKL